MGKYEFSESAEPTDKELQALAVKLQKLERKWARSRSKNALVEFLDLVFRVYSEWDRKGDKKNAARRLQKLSEIRSNGQAHAIRKIIDATSTADRRSKSRWVAALRLVLTERRRLRSLKKCLIAYGGISGCASQWADFQKIRHLNGVGPGIRPGWLSNR